MGESMKVEEQVCSLELAKKLKDLGVKQESLWYWVKIAEIDRQWILMHTDKVHEGFIYVSAFTVAELGEMLPNKIKLNFDDMRYECQLFYLNTEHGCYCSYRADMDYERDLEIEACSGNTEANVRAKMRIWLVENGKVKA